MCLWFIWLCVTFFFSYIEVASVVEVAIEVEVVIGVLEVQIEVQGVTEGCRILEEGDTTWEQIPLNKDMMITPRIMILMGVIWRITLHITLVLNRGQFLWWKVLSIVFNWRNNEVNIQLVKMIQGSRKNSLELVELPSINKVSFVWVPCVVTPHQYEIILTKRDI